MALPEFNKRAIQMPHTPTTNNTLPIIDLSNLDTASQTEKQMLAKQIGQACQLHGFFYVTGHGIPAQLQENLFQQSKQFFGLPTSQKEKVHKKFSTANRGYEPLKNQTLEAGSPPDLKEGFYIGHEHDASHPLVQTKRFNYGANQWPQDVPDLKTIALDYIEKMSSLGEKLMGLLALSLNLEEDYFSDFCQDPLVTLRLLHYPPQPATPLENEKGCGAHTDFGGLTLLLQDELGGLQVWSQKDKNWIDATPIPGSYIVNLGDMIARWTNDKYKSTLHRVINKSGKERYSIPFFYSGHIDHTVSCLTTCLSENQTPKYAPTTVEKHMIEMYQKTYGKQL